MKKLVLFAVIVFSCSVAIQAQSPEKAARRLADKVSTAFAYDLRKLDHEHLLNGRLYLTIENSGGEVEFEYKSFRSFTALERWLRGLVVQPGFPIRSSGDAQTRCRKGVCSLDLVDNQMAHNRVFLTKVYYGRSRGRLYVKKLYIIFG